MYALLIGINLLTIAAGNPLAPVNFLAIGFLGGLWVADIMASRRATQKQMGMFQ